MVWLDLGMTMAMPLVQPIFCPCSSDICPGSKREQLLHLQVQKTDAFSWSGVLPPEAPNDMKVAGVEVQGHFLPGMLVYGIPVGTGQ